MFQQAIKIQKTSGDLFNYIPPYLNEYKWYLQGDVYFHWLEVQQIGEVLEKINNEIAKQQSNSY